MSIYVGDKEIKDLYIGESTSVSDMQGPAPEGFHIPLMSEWQGLNTIMDGLSLTTGDSWKINLHMPFTGSRESSDGSLYNQSMTGIYWSSSPHGSSYPYNARYLHLDSGVYPNFYTHRASGCPIRAFKNTFVIPASSWTIILGKLGSAGIFWNKSEGLISITSDGTTGYTIQDKNLGATTVYNNGDTLTQANMGKMYQWGNNYGFSSTGSITTSSTQVNASSYGPGNYYSSSTFRKGSEDWSSVHNDNLRGGVSQGTTETGAAKEIWLGDNKVRPSAGHVNVSFSYTGSDQTWTVPYTQEYIITAKGAGSNTSAGGLGQGTITLTKGTVLKIMVGQSGSSTSSGTYGFGGTSNYSSNRSGGGLSGVFTGDSAITATSSSRALVIGGGAGGGTSGRAGGVGGGTTGATGGGSSYGTAGGGGTQTGRGSGGNAGSEQFRGGNGSGTYGWGGGGGRWGGNGSVGDGSGDDDKGAGGGSGYVISTASNRVLTQGGGSTSGNHGSVTIVSVNQ